MASSPLDLVPATSVDTAGLSVATTPRILADGRYGTIYDPVTLAACVPILFTPLDGSDHLMLYSRRWHSGTISTADPGYYTSYTISTRPGWLIVNGSTGLTRQVNASPDIPMSTAHDSAALTAACARPPHYVYLLNTVVLGTTTTAVVQHVFYNQSVKTITTLAEETIPDAYIKPPAMSSTAWENLSAAERQVQGVAVRFDRGLYLSGSHLMVFGASPTGQLFQARKDWGRIGIAATDWEYFNGVGWVSEPTSAAQLAGTTGPMTTAGPLGVALYKNRIRLATTMADGNDRYAQVWVATNYGTWRPTGNAVLLGSTADGSYQGGTLQLQPQLAAVESMVAVPASVWAIPFCYTVKTFQLGSSRLAVNWGVWQVSRLY